MPQLTIFVPSWHLEDIVRDSSEKEAAAFLNAYAVAFHPWVLCATGELPGWSAAQSPGEYEPGRVVVLPDPSSAQLPGGWSDGAEEQGTFVIRVSSDRDETLKLLHANEKFGNAVKQRLTESFERESAEQTEDFELKEPVCQEDFLAIGVVYLLTSLLSQTMYHYENIEESRFTEFVLEAARYAVLQDEKKTKELLQLACEQLQESREKFYPVDAHLIDLCLLEENPQAEDIETIAKSDHVVNLLCLAKSMEQVASKSPDAIQKLAEAVSEGTIGIIGGEYEEVPTALLPIQTQRWQLERGFAVFESLFSNVPAIWGRMRFGLSTQLPLLLKKFNVQGAYHLVLDDGIYPDDEQSHFSWEGRSGSVIPAISRIPLSVDNASSLLKLPERLAETMNHDHLACAVLARWPKIRNPWFNDILRVQKYAPVLGTFEKLDYYFEQTEDSGHHTNHEQRQYLSPDLDQLTGRNSPNAISRFSDFWKLQILQQTLAWMETTTQILNGKHEPESLIESNNRLQRVSPKLKSEQLIEQKQQLSSQVQSASSELANRLVGAGRDQAGYVLLNPLLQDRVSIVRFPFKSENSTELRAPKLQGPIKFMQLEKDHAIAIVKVPACGFAAIESVPVKQAKQSKEKVPLAGDLFLQNEFFYVQIDPKSGGIQKLRLHGSSDNILSERLVFRLDGSSGTIARGQDQWGSSSNEPAYSRMIADSIKTTSTGPVCGTIEVRGRLVRSDNDQNLAEFVRTIRVYRGIKRVQIDLEIDPQEFPAELADRSYYAHRFAWSASAAKVTGRLQQSQFHLGERRVESTGPIEIDDNDHRVTIISDHLPFHQRTEMRMLDSLLIVHGETQRKFSCEIGIDIPHAARVAADVQSPIQMVPLDRLPVNNSAWLFHVSAPSVQLINMQPDQSLPQTEDDTTASEYTTQNEQAEIIGYRFDFIETEGIHVSPRLSTFKPAKKAWELDFTGKVLEELTITDGKIQFECQPCDYVSILVQF
ncbi:MAG: hypothetical protein JKY95_02450 [Planctomycetaceae bacterium]|nr:hypothetical protein [Planctomycetaceae bacterium]